MTEIELGEVEKRDEETISFSMVRVKSDAWPESAASSNQVKASVHNLLVENSDRVNLDSIYFRQLTSEDLKEVKNLHEEWFPLSYPDSFYNRIHKNNVVAVGCFTKLVP